MKTFLALKGKKDSRQAAPLGTCAICKSGWSVKEIL